MAHVQVAVIGAGFSGLGAAIRLKQQGIADFLVFERAADVGGTWRDNSYPGCACDVPANLYSFSFAQNPGWSRGFSPQQEIWDYLRTCVERFGIGDRLRLGHDVRDASWDESARCWRIETSGGDYTAQVLVAGGGLLSGPAEPDLPGLESFTGTVFHSARWNHEHDLTGRRVAVIGTGASAVQFVPAIAPEVGRLTLFQRTAAWVLPRHDRSRSRAEHWLYRTVPAAQRLVRWSLYWGHESNAVAFLHPPLMRALGTRMARRHLARQVADPGLREALTPNYTMGCKRILVSSDYFPALTRENVAVVTEGIREVRPQGIVTVDGVEHPVDTIIFGTGFNAADPPIAQRIRGRDGRSLTECWQGSPRAYLGTTVAGFPNFFLLLGPNTALGHNSVVFMIEAQIRYLMRALRFMRSRGIAVIEPREQTVAEFIAETDRRMRPTVWLSGGCASWYLDRTGRNCALWPGYSWSYHRRLRRFDPRPYRVAPAAAVPERSVEPA